MRCRAGQSSILVQANRPRIYHELFHLANGIHQQKNGVVGDESPATTLSCWRNYSGGGGGVVLGGNINIPSLVGAEDYKGMSAIYSSEVVITTSPNWHKCDGVVGILGLFWDFDLSGSIQEGNSAIQV